MNIYLTLDYELFMGVNSGSVQNCLITPTNKLIEMMDKYKIKATFFVDGCYLLRLKELKDKYEKLNQDWKNITDQLSRLSSEGHDIELHIHPQWYDAKYVKGKWVTNRKYYKLSDFSKTDAAIIFKESKSVLYNITGIEPVAFRAGGYSIQSADYVSLFRSNNIKIDSSVLRNKKTKKTDLQFYNYSELPSKNIYRFSDNIINEKQDGEFIEASISTLRISFLKYIIFVFVKSFYLLQRNIYYKTWGDGIGSIGVTKGGKRISLKHRIHYLFSSHVKSLTIDNFNAYFLINNYKYFKKTGKDDQLIIGHPKALSPYSISVLENFICQTKSDCIFKVIKDLNY